MSDAASLTGLFGMTDFMVPMVLQGLPDEQARLRPRGEGGPSIAWTLGHLLHYRVFMLGRFGAPRDNPFGEDFGNGSATDGNDYPSVDTLRSVWEDVSTDFMTRVAELTDAELDEPLEDGWNPDQTLRDQLVFFAWHEGYHMGAIGQIRKSMGLLGPAELVRAAREADAG